MNEFRIVVYVNKHLKNTQRFRLSKINTRKLVEVFQASTDTTLFDLSDYAISFYDYEHMNRNDDFIHLINKLVEFDHLVFASPVYWYSMSAQLKVFFDRLSDLLTIEKSSVDA